MVISTSFVMYTRSLDVFTPVRYFQIYSPDHCDNHIPRHSQSPPIECQTGNGYKSAGGRICLIGGVSKTHSERGFNMTMNYPRI